MNVTLIGAGCGAGTLTRDAAEAVESADLVIGAGRLLKEQDGAFETVERVRPGEILEILQRKKPENACVLLSGDTGFYSGTAKLLGLLQENGIGARVIPGISSLQAFAAKLGRAWQNWRLCSAHGVSCDPVYEVMQGKPVFFLTSGKEGPAALCAALTEAGLGGLSVTVGERFGDPEERLETGTAQAFSKRSFDVLNVMLAEAAPVYPARVHGIPDDEFLRDEAPMTKQEVRAAALSKLALAPDDVCWDIGAGTGSVSVEMALQTRSVWAVEMKPAALETARRNREKFCAWNLHLIEGTAPAALETLPVPDAVFVGGSAGHLKEILEKVLEKAPAARICVAAVSAETLGRALDALSALGCAAEVTQISAARSRAVGGLHMMTAQNPVWLITGGRK